MAVSGQDVGVIRATAEADALTGPLKISHIIWSGATTADHLCEILDESGGTRIALFEADADDFTDVRYFFGPGGRAGKPFKGFYVNDLDSGEVYVHLV